MARKTGKKAPTSVEAVTHKDKRANIPTEELRDFIAEDEAAPKKMLYPRDASLDPQLVWKGKDERDQEDLKVPIVPIYIQESIHPQALIEGLRETAGLGEDEPELRLFDEAFDGLDFEKRIDFYQHEQNWTNRMILGDALLVMTSLAEKEGLKGKVQMIYIDPPYGIRFGSNWQVSTRKRDVKDGKVEDVTRQPEQIKAFRDTWELGIHSYLSYMRDRLAIARELLTESGSVFVQMGDENVHLVRSIMDEVFGSENFVSMISFTKAPGGLESTGRIPARLDYLLWYGRDAAALKYRPLFEERENAVEAGFDHVEVPDGLRRSLTKEERSGTAPLPAGSKLFRSVSLTKPGPGSKYTIEVDGRSFDSGGRWWGSPKETIERALAIGRVAVFGNTLRFIRYEDDFPYKPLSNLWAGLVGAPEPIYVVQTNEEVVKRCLLMSTDPGDLVVDPTCGSGTTAVAAERWGRRWIMIDTSRVALALARTRLMSATYSFYTLADSPEGVKLQSELSGQVPQQIATAADIRKGFIYRSVPRITLSSIGNNPELQAGMRKEELERAIVREAEREVLYDRPYEDSSRLRVSGPFTVESLSPHRVLFDDEDRPMSEFTDQPDYDAGQFEKMIIENLRKAGVQNTIKNERLEFNRLDVFAAEWIHAEGEYTDADGQVLRVAVSIGPEHGTVSPEQIKEAAKEAVKGVGFDVLVVCGFAFDPYVSEEAKEFGRLVVLPTRMNPDLAMGDELLKKTGAGNLFMVFGEPDLEISESRGKIVVEIRGVDVYDPTTGEIRSNSTDDVACWFIDTNYSDESFIVRHAYFTGADRPYEKVRRALKADIDEAGWESLYSTTSRPFDRPESGKIAVKVINHYGDEVLKVYDLP